MINDTVNAKITDTLRAQLAHIVVKLADCEPYDGESGACTLCNAPAGDGYNQMDAWRGPAHHAEGCPYVAARRMTGRRWGDEC
jgi:hypothetical protein